MKKQRLPRKLKKALRNRVMTYDIASIPNGVTLDNIVFYMNTLGIAFYDSTKGDAPKFSIPNKRKITKDTVNLEDNNVDDWIKRAERKMIYGDAYDIETDKLIEPNQHSLQ